LGDWTGLIVAFLLLFGNAFFVGAEFALLSARRTQIEPRAQAGSRAARITLKAMENLHLVIGVNQLGITVCSLLLGAIGEPALAHLLEPVLHAAQIDNGWLHPVAFTLSLGIVVYLHVVLGEMIPKNLALAGPDRAALILGPPVWGIVQTLRPLLIVINTLARWILRVIGATLRDEVSSSYTREEIAALVEESRGEGLLKADEYDRLAGALGFTERDISSVLMPLHSLAAVPLDARLADVEELCARTGFSRFPVLDGTQLAGYVHVKDLLETDPNRRNQPIARKWVRRFGVIPESALLHEALEALQRRGAHMGKVIDRGGKVTGLITMEDVIEELVGEIRDAAH
jgi:CBS domain containing-hemolysin-like protein